jgi:outer membrane protein TolC
MKTRHALHALLGLAPGVELPLSGEVASAIPCRNALDEAVAELPGRRPDLIALQAGYQSEEAAVRQAVLEQFPGISIGITRARDTGGVATVGLGLSISLPVFDRNRGHIAMERATRERLRQAYQARLDDAAVEAGQARDQAALLKRQLEAVKARIPELSRVASGAQKALEAGELDAATYVNVHEQLLAKRAEAIRLQGELEQARVALETLLALRPGSTEARCASVSQAGPAGID